MGLTAALLKTIPSYYSGCRAQLHPSLLSTAGQRRTRSLNLNLREISCRAHMRDLQCLNDEIAEVPVESPFDSFRSAHSFPEMRF